MNDPTARETGTILALLRDVADAEPLERIRAAYVACTMCGAEAHRPNLPNVEPPQPVPHLISCPWVRVTQVVGVKLPADDVVDAVIYCGAVLADGHGTRLDCDQVEHHPPPHQSGTVTWAELHRGADTDG